MRNFLIFISKLILILLLILTPLKSISQAGKNEILIINSRNIRAYVEAIEGLKDGLKDYRFEQVNLEEVKNKEKLLGEIEEREYSYIVLVGTEALMFFKDRTEGNRLIYTMVLDPESIVEEGTDTVSGVSLQIDPDDYLSVLFDIIPECDNIGIMYNPKNSGKIVSNLSAVLKKNNISVNSVPISELKDVPKSIELLTENVDVFWLVPDPILLDSTIFEYILMFFLENNIPIIAPSKKFVEKGCLFSIYVSNHDIGSQTAEVIKDLDNTGRPSGPLNRYARGKKIILNLNIAEKLGIKISAEVRERSCLIE